MTRTAGRLPGAFALLIGAVMTASACGASPEPTSSGAAASPPATSSSTPGRMPAQTDGGLTPEPDLVVPSGKTERLTGTVVVDTELRCRMLHLGDGRGVQLIGGDPRLKDGVTATVEGRRRPGMATTCQSGEPFEVTAVVSVS